jgi:hypothetical protein
MPNHAITEADLLTYDAYAAVRTEWRRKLSALKRLRRIEIGPYVTFYFENRLTMWHQIQEMLHIERGGAAQIPDELEAYNPLVPNGHELSATFMIEIDDAERRKQVLNRLGGIEDTAFIEIAGQTIAGTPETDQDRTTSEGKASSVQFVHFRFTPAQIAAFRSPSTRVVVGLNHPKYSHMAVLPEAMRVELSGDFD